MDGWTDRRMVRRMDGWMNFTVAPASAPVMVIRGKFELPILYLRLG